MIGSSELNSENANNSDRFELFDYQKNCKDTAQSLQLLLENDDLWKQIVQF